MHENVWTLREIQSQPQVWNECLGMLQQTDLSGLVAGREPERAEWIFIGCGTSFYLAQAAASSLNLLLGVSARAIPASEFLLFPTLVVPHDRKSYFPVLISRSGHTSEVLQVARHLQSQGISFLAVTCDGRELTDMTPRVLRMPVVEKSTVMTSSFTSMLLGLQYLAATLAGKTQFLDSLKTLPAELNRLLEIYTPRIESFAQIDVEDVAFLGQGALYPIASETALKVMETSCTYAQYFHTLEFRHGPKSIVGPKTLVGALLSETGYEQEAAVLREMKELDAYTMAVANTASPALRNTADLLIELGLSVPELARIAVYVVWGQLFGSYRGLAKGLDPDNPRNLSRVVTI
ncbi:SIS domain-containing protein [Edaphobacter modestus]|uniref:Glucosamine--fructose-6-phosphate aminotransferase (Isomerizing) n=1 Tax=Edaphobacter modestus TaxID=388466 RepID=A0A4Q7YSN8_9BACT|nr:SIS domain-containing protein [Edaphobacter modestus]RZU40254.1 glucosamine--fructose-6-phosphate aminotransferase (isomerizing) [Edaphobacter modestus]